MPKTCGFNDVQGQLLKTRFGQMTELERQVSICFDEAHLDAKMQYSKQCDQLLGKPDLCGAELLMTPKQLKSHQTRIANSVTVFVVTGLNRKYSLLFDHYTSANSVPGSALKELMLRSIRNVRKAGGVVRQTTSDGGSTNCTALRLLGLFVKMT
jgi:hypothetical protein